MTKKESVQIHLLCISNIEPNNTSVESRGMYLLCSKAYIDEDDIIDGTKKCQRDVC